jgi:hypothetical protein
MIESVNVQINNVMTKVVVAPGPTKPGEVDEILTLHQLKLPSLDSKAKLKSPCFFLQVHNITDH